MSKDRDARGRFKPGNKAAKNGGRPSKPREERYTEILREAVTFAQFERIVRRIAQKAERGDLPAAKLLFEYIIGKPPQQYQLTGRDGGAIELDLDEWKRQRQERLERTAQMEDGATD